MDNSKNDDDLEAMVEAIEKAVPENNDQKGEEEKAYDTDSEYDDLYDAVDGDGDGHIDMGDGNFIAIRSFHEIEKRGKKKVQTAEEIEADRKAERYVSSSSSCRYTVISVTNTIILKLEVP